MISQQLPVQMTQYKMRRFHQVVVELSHLVLRHAIADEPRKHWRIVVANATLICSGNWPVFGRTENGHCQRGFLVRTLTIHHISDDRARQAVAEAGRAEHAASREGGNARAAGAEGTSGERVPGMRSRPAEAMGCLAVDTGDVMNHQASGIRH